MERYYLDSCIWRDYLEDRTDGLRPLGEWAFALLRKAAAESSTVIYSDLVEEELSVSAGLGLKDALSAFPSCLFLRVCSTPAQLESARRLARDFCVPLKDALHACIAADCGAIVVTRDKHFSELWRVVRVQKPEELI